MPYFTTLPDGLVSLAFHHSRVISDKLLRELLISVDQATDLFTWSIEQLSDLGISNAELIYRELAEIATQLEQTAYSSTVLSQQWQYCLDYDIGVVSLCSDRYPALLKQIYDPPPILYYRGNLALAQQPQLAMVGSRRSTEQGNHNARQFAQALAKGGFTITSGLALGIDTVCHQAVIDVSGDTIAVLGTGIDVIYPARNQRLYSTLIECGLLLSEQPLGAAAKKNHFPRRNRIISGLSLGVLVVEAASQSGSLISARCAMEQNREVFAIPGSIHNPASRGCHALIRQGACLVETVDDIFAQLQGWLPKDALCVGPQQGELLAVEPPLALEHQQLLDKLGYDPQPLEYLQQQSSLTVSEIIAALLHLELRGLIEQVAGNYQRIH